MCQFLTKIKSGTLSVGYEAKYGVVKFESGELNIPQLVADEIFCWKLALEISSFLEVGWTLAVPPKYKLS